MAPKSWFFFVAFGILICVVLVSTDHRPFVDLKSEAENRVERGNLEAYRYDRYLNFEEMESRLQSLSTIYSNKLSLKVVGRSVEGRNIYLVTITNNVKRSESSVSSDQQKEKSPNSVRMQRRMPFNILEERDLDSDSVSNQTQNVTVLIPESKVDESQTKFSNVLKPVIFVDAGIHAREWVAPAAAFYLIDQLMATPSLTADLEWRIIPQVNPDGYVFSKTSDRFWRKNRAITSQSNCVGVDLNRNFDVHFEETVSNPCSEVYGGPYAFSEPESQAIRNEIEVVKDRLQAYITIHTYGQMFLYPFGYTSQKSPVAVNKLRSMGDGMAKAVSDQYQSEYTVAQASMIGAAAGGSDDWAYISGKAPYSYTFELQPKVHHLKFRQEGFDLTEAKLKQAVDECWLALKYLGNSILSEINPLKRKPAKNNQPPPPIGAHEPTATVYKGDELAMILARVPDSALPELVWTDVIQRVDEVKRKANLKRNSDVEKDCIIIDAVYVCPHMVFWNSMHT